MISDAISEVSPDKRDDIIYALSRGAVPKRGLDLLAVGLERFAPAFDDELARVSAGNGLFKAIRGEYGAGKTFCVRWLTERAKRLGFATAEVQISEAETPLHRLETVYRRAMERLSTTAVPSGALPDVVDAWFYRLESDVLDAGGIDETDEAALAVAVEALMEKRLADVSRVTSSFATALRAYHRAMADGDVGGAQSLMAWLAGQPNVGAKAKRAAGLKGDIDHFAALNAFRGLLSVLRDSGHRGLVLVLDEVETLQRVRSDAREKSLNALRAWIDELDQGHYPGLYVVITGTPAFFDGPQGVQRLAPLAQRLATDFQTEARFDNPRAAQIRLQGLDRDGLVTLGLRVRDLFAAGQPWAERVHARCDDAWVASLADAVGGRFGGNVRVAPRLFLKKLVTDVLQRVAEFDDFDPRQHYKLTLDVSELTDDERAAAGVEATGASSVDDIELDL